MKTQKSSNEENHIKYYSKLIKLVKKYKDSYSFSLLKDMAMMSITHDPIYLNEFACNEAKLKWEKDNKIDYLCDCCPIKHYNNSFSCNKINSMHMNIYKSFLNKDFKTTIRLLKEMKNSWHNY